MFRIVGAAPFEEPPLSTSISQEILMVTIEQMRVEARYRAMLRQHEEKLEFLRGLEAAQKNTGA